MTTETWYPFPGRPDYEISDEGGLRTIDGTSVPLQTVPNGDACFYSIKSPKGDYFNKYSPDDLIEWYLPAATKD